MEEQISAENLLDVMEQSGYISPDTFVGTLVEAAREGSLLPWGKVSEDRLPLPDILKDMHREEAVEALYDKRVITEGDLQRFREELLATRLEYLACENIDWTPIRFRSSEPASVREEARLYRQCIETYLDRKSKYEPQVETIREDLEYVEILAGKIAYGFPALGVSDKYNREILERLVETYAKGLEDIAEEYGLTPEEHAAKERQARTEIDHLYPPRE